MAKRNLIGEGILRARFGCVSEIAREMPGQEEANYKCIQRFEGGGCLKSILLRLYQEEAGFMIGDPTETPRSQADKTEHVGKLSDG